MRYVLQQRVLGFGADFHIKDEQGQPHYFVDGFAFTFGQKFSFQDMRGNELLLIKQKLLTFSPTYLLIKSGHVTATVRRSWLAFRNTFTIDVPGPDDYTVTGSWLQNEYQFQRNGEVVATISKKWLRQSDTYSVEISPRNENHILLLGCAICIDMVCHNRKSKFNR